jgi:hypothetical protein
VTVYEDEDEDVLDGVEYFYLYDWWYYCESTLELLDLENELANHVHSAVSVFTHQEHLLQRILVDRASVVLIILDPPLEQGVLRVVAEWLY